MLLVYQSSYQSSHWLLYEIKIIFSYRSHTGNESVSGGVKTKLKVGAQLQTFSYPTISKSPQTSSSNAVWEKSLGKTSPFKSVTDRQTDTHKQKTRHFSALVGVRSPSPTKLCTVTEDVLVGPYLKNVFGSDVQFRHQRALKIWR